MKKASVILCLLLCMALLFAGCQKEQPTTEITENPAAEPFIGCWESYESFSWICIYDDGTYELVNEDGKTSGPYPYEIEGGELTLTDSGMTLQTNEPDNPEDLKSSRGEEFYRSQLPDFDENEETEYTADKDIQHKFELSQQFSGSWRCEDLDGWIMIEPYNDAVYYTYNSEGMEMGMGGDFYEIRGDELYLTAHDVTLSLTEDGEMISSTGYTLVRAPIEQAENHNDLLAGDWVHSEGEYSLNFDGVETFTLVGPGSLSSGRYLYTETGIHIYNFGVEVDFGILDEAGNITLNSVEGYFYPADYN